MLHQALFSLKLLSGKSSIIFFQLTLTVCQLRMQRRLLLSQQRPLQQVTTSYVQSLWLLFQKRLSFPRRAKVFSAFFPACSMEPNNQLRPFLSYLYQQRKAMLVLRGTSPTPREFKVQLNPIKAIVPQHGYG